MQRLGGSDTRVFRLLDNAGKMPPQFVQTVLHGQAGQVDLVQQGRPPPVQRDHRLLQKIRLERQYHRAASRLPAADLLHRALHTPLATAPVVGLHRAKGLPGRLKSPAHPSHTQAGVHRVLLPQKQVHPAAGKAPQGERGQLESIALMVLGHNVTARLLGPVQHDHMGVLLGRLLQKGGVQAGGSHHQPGHPLPNELPHKKLLFLGVVVALAQKGGVPPAVKIIADGAAGFAKIEFQVGHHHADGFAGAPAQAASESVRLIAQPLHRVPDSVGRERLHAGGVRQVAGYGTDGHPRQGRHILDRGLALPCHPVASHQNVFTIFSLLFSVQFKFIKGKPACQSAYSPIFIGFYRHYLHFCLYFIVKTFLLLLSPLPAYPLTFIPSAGHTKSALSGRYGRRGRVLRSGQPTWPARGHFRRKAARAAAD